LFRNSPTDRSESIEKKFRRREFPGKLLAVATLGAMAAPVLDCANGYQEEHQEKGNEAQETHSQESDRDKNTNEKADNFEEVGEKERQSDKVRR
jgi:hypothetical protein